MPVGAEGFGSRHSGLNVLILAERPGPISESGENEGSIWVYPPVFDSVPLLIFLWELDRALEVVQRLIYAARFKYSHIT